MKYFIGVFLLLWQLLLIFVIGLAIARAVPQYEAMTALFVSGGLWLAGGLWLHNKKLKELS